MSNVLSQNLDNYLSDYAHKWPLSGTVLVAQQGEIIYRNAFGYASIEHQVPNEMDTKFRIWSITKSFTAMAIMMLYEKNLLRLDDSVSLYIPELKESNITIVQLLTHTSGLSNYTNLPQYNTSLNKLKLSHSEVLNLFADKALTFEPGTSFSYTNSGYYLLGMIVERITGLRYTDFINGNILVPLGMKNSGVDNNMTILPNMCSSYHASRDHLIQSEYLDMSSSFSAGAMYATVEDLYKWDQAFYTESLVSQATLDMIFKPNDYRYGFGWFIDHRYDRRRVFHGGAYRGCRSELHRYPDEQSTIILLTNYDFVPISNLADSLAGILFGENILVPTLPPSYSLDDTIYANYMGTYEGFGCKAIVDRKDDQLFFVWNDEAILPFYPVSATTFHHTWLDWSCTFQKTSNGEISFLGMQKKI